MKKNQTAEETVYVHINGVFQFRMVEDVPSKPIRLQWILKDGQPRELTVPGKLVSFDPKTLPESTSLNSKSHAMYHLVENGSFSLSGGSVDGSLSLTTLKLTDGTNLVLTT